LEGDVIFNPVILYHASLLQRHSFKYLWHHISAHSKTSHLHTLV